MSQTLIIKGDLPALNEIIQAAKINSLKYATLKKNNGGYIAWMARAQGLKHVDVVDVIIVWYCRDRRKDKDNIMAGQKFIFDGLQEAGILSNDGWQNIRDITHKFEVDRLKPRIEIELKEVV